MKKWNGASGKQFVSLQIKITVTEAQWAQWRVFYSEHEIKSYISEEGTAQLDERIDQLVERALK